LVFRIISTIAPITVTWIAGHSSVSYHGLGMTGYINELMTRTAVGTTFQSTLNHGGGQRWQPRYHGVAQIGGTTLGAGSDAALEVGGRAAAWRDAGAGRHGVG
jgi:hypothetical protein